jgi:hypothetical protein
VFGLGGTREPIQNSQSYEYYQANHMDRTSAFVHIPMPSKIFLLLDYWKKHNMTYSA